MKFIFTYIFILISFVSFSQTPQIGDFLEGGVVFWLNPNNSAEGLVCDIEDIAQGVQWGLSNVFDETSLSLGSGELNTTLMVNSPQSFPAAEYCVSSTNSGYNDWFLPSQEELMQICLNQNIINETSLNNGGSSLLPSWYWSSSNSGTLAWHVYFPNCGTNDTYHSQNFNVRAVRSFSLLAGCTDSLSFNFDPNANIDNGSCMSIIEGCTDETAFNYDITANTDDGSCVPVVYGCTDETSINYNEIANVDDGACIELDYSCNDSNYTQIGQTIIGELHGNKIGHDVSLSGSGLVKAVSSTGNNDLIGEVTIYKFENNNWIQLGQKLLGTLHDSFGKSISLNNEGDRIIITSYSNDNFLSNAGMAQVFEYDGINWIQLGSNIYGQEENEIFGQSCSINNDGDIIVISSKNSDAAGYNSGVIRIYRYIENNWLEYGQIVGEENERFGFSCDISDDGNIIAVSSQSDNGGKVKVFSFDSDEWIQVGQTVNAESTNDSFYYGISLNSNGTKFSIGSPGGSTGYIKVYELLENNEILFWSQVGTAIYGDSTSGNFGFDTKINSNGDFLVIGDPNGRVNDINIGYTKVYKLNELENSYELFREFYGNSILQNFGYSVDISDNGKIATFGLKNDFYVNDSIHGKGSVKTYAIDESLHICQGCTDSLAINFNSNAIEDDGSCIDAIYGCTDSLALNFDSFANTDDGSCCGAVLSIPFGTQIGLDIDGETSQDFSGWSVSLSYDGNRVAIGAMDNDGNGNQSGHVRVFEKIDTSWFQVGQDIDGEAANDESGYSVSISDDGNIVAIGARYNDGNGFGSGHVRVYHWNGSSWNQLGEDIDGEGVNDGSGFSVSLNSNGNIIAIGAPDNDGGGLYSSAGHVRVYEYNGSSWNQIGQDIDGLSDSERVGYSVSLNGTGNIFATTVPKFMSANDDSYVRVYNYINYQWNQIGQDIYDPLSDNHFKFVSLNYDGNVLVIGAPSTDGGYVKIYEFINNIWQQVGQDFYAGSTFGESVSISDNGNKIAVGETENSGVVRIYEKINNSYVQIGQEFNGENSGDGFGRSVSISGDGNTLASGAGHNDGNGYNSGHVRVFSLGDSQTSPPCSGCIDSLAVNYDPYSLIEDESCLYSGCTDSIALNFDPLAVEDDGSCTYCYADAIINDGLDTIVSCDSVFLFANDVENGSYHWSTSNEPAELSIGDFFQGGVVFWVNPDDNTKGFVSDIDDLGILPYGCPLSSFNTSLNNGNQNTLNIVSGCSDSSFAALSCYNSSKFGYSDWYLPSFSELELMFNQKIIINNISVEYGGSQFENSNYLSSSELNPSIINNSVKTIYFLTGGNGYTGKHTSTRFRAIRSISTQFYPTQTVLVSNSGWNFLTITDSLGCTSVDSIYVEIGTCGCTDEAATNYNELATIDDGSCIDAIYGCTDSLALNFDSFANTNDESCLYGIDGCMDYTACNFNPDATITLFVECIYPEYGYDCSGLCLFDESPIVYYQQSYDFMVSIDVNYSNQFYQIYNQFFSTNLELHLNNPFVDTSFTIDIEETLEYGEYWFQLDDQFCGIYQPYVIWLNSPSGCSDTLELITYYSFQVDFGNDINSNNICDGLEISGCTDSTALNFDFQATLDDGSCIEIIQGCTDSTANNYLSDANVDDGSCSYCTIDAEIISQNPTNQTFCNGYYAITPYGQSPYNYYIDGQAGQQYSASVCNGIYEVLVTDANNCQFEQTLVLSNYVGCMDIDALNYDETALFDDGSCIDVVLGCMDELADNYNENANVDDDNCIYYGCTDISADNFDESANVDDESCIYCDIYITGLVNNPNTSTDCNGLIILSINSSHEPVDITWNNGSVGGFINNICAGEYLYVATDAQGCELTDTVYIDGSATGCTDPLACNYQEGANIDDGSCLFLDPIDLELNSTSDAELVLSWSNYPNSDMYYIYKGYNSSSLSFLDSTDSNSYLDEFINLQNTYYKVYTNTSCNGQDYLISSDAIQYTYTEELSIEITVNEPSCLCCNDGSVSYIVSGGTPPYSLSNWNQLDSISSGQTIQVYVSDAAGSFPIYEEFIFGFENETYGCTDPIAQNYDECASLDDASCEYDEVSACDVLPQGLFVDNIIHNRVRFNWSEPIAFPSYYMIRYRPVGTTSWTVMTAGPTNSNEFTGTSRTRYFMESETTYQWNIRARDVDDNGSTICQSPWSETKEFTTLPDCPNLVNLSTNTEANWVDFMAESVDSEIEIYDSKGKLRIVDENNYRYITGSSEGIDFRKGNFIPSTAYEWHTKTWCVGNVDADGNPDPQYHSGWGEFSEFTTEDPCDKIPTNLVTTTNGSQNLITMNWDTPLSGEPDHYFLELNNETTGQVFQWNNISGSATSKTKYNQIPGHSFNWRIRGACGTTGTSWATIFTQPVYYTLGASRLSNIDKLNVYPNPSRDVFNVSFEVKQAEDLRLEVINVLGEIIIEENIESFKGSYLNSLDMSSQSNGIYLLKIYTNNGISTTKLTLQ